MRYVFITFLLFLASCSPGTGYKTKTYIQNPNPISNKVDLNNIKIQCLEDACPKSLALFVTVYKFKTLNSNQSPNTYQAFKTCNASVVKKDLSLYDQYELYTSGHCSHKEADLKKFEEEYPELKNYSFQSRSHHLYIYSSKVEDTLKINLPEPDWNYYNPEVEFSLDIMKFTLAQELFSDLKLSLETQTLPSKADLFTIRRNSGSNYVIQRQTCDITNNNSGYSAGLETCLIKGGDSGAAIIDQGIIYGFVSHTNNRFLGGQFVPSYCIADDTCS